MDEEQEVVPAEAATEPVEPVETAPEPEADTTDYKALAEQHEQAFKDQKRRAEKAEAKLKQQTAQPAAQPQVSGDLSSKDILALSSASVTEEEDVEFLQKAAATLGVTVAQAVKDPTVATLLKEKQDERHTAAATSLGNTRRVPSERKGSDLLEAAKTGTLPDPKDIRKLVRASMGLDS